MVIDNSLQKEVHFEDNGQNSIYPEITTKNFIS